MTLQAPLALEPRCVARDTYLIGAWVPIPTLGALPLNAFVIKAAQPVLVDTGMAAMREHFLESIQAVLDPQDLRWIWITHMDADHVGNLAAVLERAPRARVVTTFIGLAKMGLLGLPQDRAYLVNPGQELDVGDRRLLAAAPPIFDAPETNGFLDAKSRALYCSDCFGAAQPEVTEWANEVPPETLARAMAVWANADAPWLGMVDRAVLRERLRQYAGMGADVMLGSHLQPAKQMASSLARAAEDAVAGPAFVGPDQATVGSAALV